MCSITDVSYCIPPPIVGCKLFTHCLANTFRPSEIVFSIQVPAVCRLVYKPDFLQPIRLTAK